MIRLCRERLVSGTIWSLSLALIQENRIKDYHLNLIPYLLVSRSPNTYSFLGGLHFNYINNMQSIYVR